MFLNCWSAISYDQNKQNIIYLLKDGSIGARVGCGGTLASKMEKIQMY